MSVNLAAPDTAVDLTRYISLFNSIGHATDLRLSKGNLEAMFLLNNRDIVNNLLSRAVSGCFIPKTSL